MKNGSKKEHSGNTENVSVAKNCRFISYATLLFSIILTFLIWKFNHGGHGLNKYIVGNAMLLLWVPMLTVFFVFRGDMKDFGMKLPENGKWIWSVTAVCMLAIVFILYAPSKWPQFQDYYPIFKQFRHSDPIFWTVNPFKEDFGKMFFAEASYGFYMFCWEFFFRGYLTCAMSKTFGLWAVLIQAVPFMILHIGKPVEEVISSFFAGIILGLIAYYGKSFLPAFIIHYWVSIMFDIMVIFNRG